jgi:hypothetical protein
MRLSRRVRFVATARRFVASFEVSEGDTWIAAPPHTSRNAGTSEVITGHPQRIASIVGKPKPSVYDGKISVVAAEYSALRSAVGTYPR